ncbi:neurofilament heavy polypeptide-like [Impatiens glandulifera]|uniref:neurofilament heavy polypeptide-like n=1 Tax=Impatiens glandulifera TaxID=253017 RepID=UPI001FB0F361|nr:neurofilament heavy polypeptide-like [Impatiens glandulifera]
MEEKARSEKPLKEKAPAENDPKEKTSKDEGPKEAEPKGKAKQTAVKEKQPRLKSATRRTKKPAAKKTASKSHESERTPSPGASPGPYDPLVNNIPINVVIPIMVHSSPEKEKDATENVPSPKQAKSSASRVAKSPDRVSILTHNSEIRKSPPKDIANTLEKVQLRTSDVVLDIEKEVTRANNDEATNKIVEEGQGDRADRIDDLTNEVVNNEEEIPTSYTKLKETMMQKEVQQIRVLKTPFPTPHHNRQNQFMKKKKKILRFREWLKLVDLERIIFWLTKSDFIPLAMSICYLAENNTKVWAINEVLEASKDVALTAEETKAKDSLHEIISKIEAKISELDKTIERKIKE